MEIVLAEATHIPGVMDLITACVQEMRRNGIDQWDESYPNAEVVENDVKNQSLYLLEETQGLNEKTRCIAAMSLNQEQHPAYQTVSWMGSEPVLAVHRLCVDPRHQRMGIAKRMMAFAESHARQHQCASIRLDTHSSNPPALKLYEGLGYRKAGEVYFRGKTAPFFCFEKIISNRMNNHMKTLEQITDEILDLAAEHFGVPRASLTPDDDFYKKLGIDSLQALELLTRLENHFAVELPDYEVQGVSDFRTLATRIQARL